MVIGTRLNRPRGPMPSQITSFDPHARPPNSFRKSRPSDLILFSQILSMRNEGRHEPDRLIWAVIGRLSIWLAALDTGGMLRCIARRTIAPRS